MKKKFITQAEYKKCIRDKEKLNFYDKSPISSISLPKEKAIFFAA